MAEPDCVGVGVVVAFGVEAGHLVGIQDRPKLCQVEDGNGLAPEVLELLLDFGYWRWV